MHNRTTTLLRAGVLAGLLASAGAAFAAPISFDFKDPKGVNNIAFQLDAPLEQISGTGTGISGTIVFDPAAPEKISGKIVVATESLSVGNGMMKEHMLGKNWLNAPANPEITFEAVSAANVKTSGTATTADVTGKLTLNGVTKELTVPVSFTFLADKFGARLNKPELKGDLLVVRSSFKVNRGDFNIQKGKNLDKVSEEIAITLSLAGSAPKS